MEKQPPARGERREARDWGKDNYSLSAAQPPLHSPFLDLIAAVPRL